MSRASRPERELLLLLLLSMLWGASYCYRAGWLMVNRAS
jgi:hypothetical protein